MPGAKTPREKTASRPVNRRLIHQLLLRDGPLTDGQIAARLGYEPDDVLDFLRRSKFVKRMRRDDLPAERYTRGGLWGLAGKRGEKPFLVR